MIFQVDPSDPSPQNWPITPTPNRVRNVNQDLADKLTAESLNNPQSPYFGKFVGLANGQVVVITDDLDELARGLQGGIRPYQDFLV